MHVFFLGASKNIGYFAAIRLLKQGASATFLLRSPAVFDNDTQIQSYIKDGKVQLVQGDGLKVEDVRNAWESALQFGQGTVDAVVFTIGGTPSFKLTKGFFMETPDLCTRSLMNTIRTLPAALRVPDAQPHFVAVTSMGITAASHASVPLAMKPVYNLLLPAPHADKLGMERLLVHCMGLAWTEPEPLSEVLAAGWQDTEGLLGAGELKHVVIIRPAMLTDGPCRGDDVLQRKHNAPYRTIADAELQDAYRVSRQDTAHFIVHGVLANWSTWEGKAVTVAY